MVLLLLLPLASVPSSIFDSREREEKIAENEKKWEEKMQEENRKNKDERRKKL